MFPNSGVVMESTVIKSIMSYPAEGAEEFKLSSLHPEVRISSEFILQSPPGEFNEVFSDVRSLVNNDVLLKEGIHQALAQYSKEQLTPVKVDGSDYPTLITDYNDLGDDKFYDPRSQQSFKYDQLRREAFIIGKYELDLTAEPWRKAIQDFGTLYVQDHYKHGTFCVFSKVEDGVISLTACIEDHQFQPNNFWNGRWRSVWNLSFKPDSPCAYICGVLKIQVHYYEDGNVQLLSSKEVTDSLILSSEQQVAAEFIQIVGDAETEYQMALSESYQTMSDTIFKALRRSLPVTRTKIDWTKILTHNKVTSDLKNR